MIKDDKLSFEEQRLVQLDILNEVDAVCKHEGIKYSLAFGTLLGAIRHKGYIPWDDDLDIMMPYEELVRLRNSLCSDSIKFYDSDTDRTYGNAFANICSERTYRLIGKKKERGLGIDVYPIVKIPNDQERISVFFNKASELQNKRKKAIALRMFMLKHLSFCLDIGYHQIIKSFHDFLVSYNSNDSSMYYIIAGPLELREKMIYDRNLFGEIIEVDFEGKKYPAIKDFDYFLKLRYGDYMKLPPEEERHPYHGAHYYWEY